MLTARLEGKDLELESIREDGADMLQKVGGPLAFRRVILSSYLSFVNSLFRCGSVVAISFSLRVCSYSSTKLGLYVQETGEGGS